MMSSVNQCKLRLTLPTVVLRVVTHPPLWRVARWTAHQERSLLIAHMDVVLLYVLENAASLRRAKTPPEKLVELVHMSR